MARIPESALVLPTLYLLSLNDKGFIATSDLIEQLIDILQPTDEDMEMSASRPDSKFSQTVRNLKSHRKLDKMGFAESTNDGFRINQQGLDYVQDNMEEINYLINADFTFQDKQRDIAVIEKEKQNGKKPIFFDENSVVQEGAKKIIQTKVYQRSSKLRDASIHKFIEKNGKLFCEVCGFDFEKEYGELGKDYIEAHHKKPIYHYEGENTESFIYDSVKNIAMLCANCHKMVHRRRSEVLSIDELREIRSKQIEILIPIV